jgi:heme A synthase
MVAPHRARSLVPAGERSPLFTTLIGLASLGVLLQGVWAGLFIREGQDFRPTWVGVHSIDATVTGALALIAVVVAFVQLRHRRDVVAGSVVFLLLLVLEMFLGGLIGDSPGLAAVHIPLALALMGMAVWLPLRAARRG